MSKQLSARKIVMQYFAVVIFTAAACPAQADPAAAEEGIIEGLWVRKIESGEASLSIRPDGTYLVSYEGLGHRPDETGTVLYSSGRYWLARAGSSARMPYSISRDGTLTIDSDGGSMQWVRAESGGPAGPLLLRAGLPRDKRERAIALLKSNPVSAGQLPKAKPFSRALMADAGRSFSDLFEKNQPQQAVSPPDGSFTFETGPDGRQQIRFGDGRVIKFEDNGGVVQQSNDSEDDRIFNAMMSEDWDSAEDLLNRIIQRDPKNVTALINLAECQLHLEKYQQQLDSADKVILLSRQGYIVGADHAVYANPYSKKDQQLIQSNLASGFRQRGIANFFLSNHQQAILDFDQAAQLPRGPGPDAYLYRSQAKLNLGRLSEAKADIELAIQADPKDSKSYCVRSVINKRSGNYLGGMLDLAKVRELDPDFEQQCRLL